MSVDIVFYTEEDGSIPLVEWLDRLIPKVRDKAIVRLERLMEFGHELRRPEADYLRNGIYELRVCYRRVQYRMLYFFYRKSIVVISHGLVKKQVVPEKEIQKAIERKARFEENPEIHSAGGST